MLLAAAFDVLFDTEVLRGPLSSPGSALRRARLHSLRSNLQPHFLECCVSLYSAQLSSSVAKGKEAHDSQSDFDDWRYGLRRFLGANE